MNFTDFGSLIGGTGADDFTLNLGTLSDSVDGGAGSNSLTGDNAVNAWTLTGPDTGTVTGITNPFLNIGSVVGNALADTFAVSGLFGGSADGAGGGNDHLDLSTFVGDTDVDLNSEGTDGLNGEVFDTIGPNTIATFSNIDVITGRAADTHTLTANNSFTTAWTINGLRSGDVDGATQTLTWNNFDSIAAGGSAEQYNLDNAFPGTINGGGGADTFNLTDLQVIVTLEGGGGSDTIVADDVVNNWTVSASDGGLIVGGATQNYAQIENLQGGTADDTFTFDDGITVAGTIDGGAGGVDTLSFTNFTSAVSLAINTLNDIENLVGSTQITDEIVGADVANAWTITGNGTGDINGITYTGWEDLTGGSNVDTFAVNASHTGNFAGGGGADIFNFAASTTTTGTVAGEGGGDTFTFADLASIDGGAAVALDGGPGTDTMDFSAWVALQAVSDGGNSGSGSRGTVGIGGGAGVDVLVSSNVDEYFDIDSVIGNGGGLAGPNQANVWIITGTDAGTLNGTGFNNFLLIGNVDTDDFSLTTTGNLTGGINGGGGAGLNTFTANDGADATITITGARAGTHTDTNGTVTFSNIDDVSGGSANDTFNLNVSFTGTIDGGAGADTFNFTNGVAVGVLLGGGGANDTLVADNVVNTWTITGVDAGDLGAQSFSEIENLTGNTLVDSFVFQDGAAISGTLDGGTGVSVDILDTSAYTAQTDVTLTGLGADNGFAGGIVNGGTIATFDNVNSLLGGTDTANNELTGPNLAVTPGTLPARAP